MQHDMMFGVILSGAQETEQRVARGMAWLDEKSPGWEQEINLGQLDMNDPCRCVLGQLLRDKAEELDFYSGFAYGAHLLGREEYATAAEYGFDITYAYDGFRELEEEWVRQIKHRYDTGQLSGRVRPA